MSPSKSGYAPVNGVDVWYEIHGEGKPMILLHGGFGSTGMFAPILPTLAAHRQVIAVDLQGHGRTGPLGRPMTFEAMATDIAELIRYLGFEKADVMGYSLGGATALRIAIDHPEVVDRLVLVSTAYAFANWHDYNQEGMGSMAGNLEATIEGMKQTPMYELYKAVARDPETSWPKAVAEVASLVGQDYDWSADVPGIKVPTLLVYADWDAVRVSAVAKFFAMLGGSAQDAGWDGSGRNANRLAVLPGATHYDIFTSPLLPQVVELFLSPPVQPQGM